MSVKPSTTKAWVKTLPYRAPPSGPGAKVAIERTHLMRVDGVGELSTVKQQLGPVAGFLDALARGLAASLGKRPEDLQPEDLGDDDSPTISRLVYLVDHQLRVLYDVTTARSEARFPRSGRDQLIFRERLRQRVTARMLHRLPSEFVRAANRMIVSEARRRDSEVWL